MRICITYLGKKGAGNIITLEMAKALSLRCEVLVLAAAESDNITEWRKSGLKVIEVTTYEEVKDLKSQIRRIASTFNVKKFHKLKKQIDEFNPDIIYHTMSYPWLPIINLLGKRFKIIFTIHDPKMHLGEENFILDKINKISIKQADRIVILSKTFVKDLVQMGIEESKIDVIPHGNFSHYRKSEGDKERIGINKTILYLGRIEKYKGLSVLLKAYKLVKDKVSDAKLIIAGSGDLSSCYELLSELKDVEIINKWLSDDEIEQIVKRSNFIVLPYIEASQSGVIPIAYAFKLPVIASKLGGIPEQVIDNETGILVEPGNPLELAENCIKLLESPRLAEGMGQCGYEFSKKYMDWNYCGDLLLQSAEKSLRQKI